MLLEKMLENIDVALYIRKSRADQQAEKEAALRGESYDTLARHRTELLSITIKDYKKHSQTGGAIIASLMKSIKLKYNSLDSLEV